MKMNGNGAGAVSKADMEKLIEKQPDRTAKQ